MLLTYVPAVLLALGLLVSPGVVWAWRCYPSASGVMRLTVGLALGIVYQIHVCELLALGPGITRASVWVATFIGLMLAIVLAWRWPSRIPSLPTLRWRGWTQAAQLGGVLVVISAVWSIPLAFHQLPEGWDPSFHALLASNTLATGRLPTWRPFEPIPSNYPYGPHVLLAQISLLTGVAPYQVFSPLLSAGMPLLTGLALYVFARRALRRHLAALG
ncbi:MAG TPA: hypothetical protein VKQ36_10270, partial [Ktedonobacterales bacterium]|nr:hypothetical protein [Ktedonobacterales bacterium]